MGRPRIALVVLCILLAGCGGLAAQDGPAASPGETPDTPASTAAETPVTTPTPVVVTVTPSPTPTATPTPTPTQTATPTPTPTPTPEPEPTMADRVTIERQFFAYYGDDEYRLTATIDNANEFNVTIETNPYVMYDGEWYINDSGETTNRHRHNIHNSTITIPAESEVEWRWGFTNESEFSNATAVIEITDVRESD